MTEARPRILGPILLFALLTLGVTALRIYGELHEGDERWFGRKAGGGGSWLGIVWLVPIAGAVFAWKLAKLGGGPKKRAHAILLPLLAIVLVVAFFALVMPKKEDEAPAVPFRALGPVIWLVLGIGAWLATRGWPTLGRANLTYGLLARIPIVALTFYAFQHGWTDTHLVGMAPFAPKDMSDAEKIFWLVAAQIFVWIPFTMILGGLTGGLVALFARPSASSTTTAAAA